MESITTKSPAVLLTESRWLGRISYADGLTAQDKAAGEVRDRVARGERSALILGLEHEPVVTLGKRGVAEADLRATPAEIAAQGVELRISERGGQATLHSPGQLVIYPIIPIRELGIGVRDFVTTLEDATLDFFAAHGITARRGCCGEPGLYTDKGKIAFFGLRVSQGVTSHGISINVANDLGLFHLIRSCGVEKESFDRMRDHGVGFTIHELFEAWCPYFERRLQAQIAT
jgi:lipoate-protein ligase B